MNIILKYSQFLNEKISHEESLIRDIKKVLTPDLLKGYWKKVGSENSMAGHCYVATETLYWLLGGPDGPYKPFVLGHNTWPEGLDEGETHWFLKNMETGEILDPTKEQFGDINIAYDKGTPNGMMNFPKGGSKRAREVMRRLQELD
jgi:hypothetical protein